MVLTAAELASMTDGELLGNPATILTHPSKIEEGQEGSICFLSNPKYEHYLYETKASLVIVSKDFEAKQEVKPALLKVDNVAMTVSRLLAQFDQSQQTKSHSIHPSAVISTSSKLSDNVYIAASVVIEDNTIIGENVQIHPQVYIGSNVTIGKNTILFPGVKIYKDCVIGEHVILHSNVVIGSDGFGFTPNEHGVYSKVPQIGNVQIGNHVEIGANTTVDRGTLGSTIIGNGVKLDNLIQIAHNVNIGENTVIAAQTGIAGSTKIGKNCMIGGQVGIVGHITIADGVMIQAQSGISSSIKEINSKWYGSPAMNYQDFLRSFVEFRKLPELRKKLEDLIKFISHKS